MTAIEHDLKRFISQNIRMSGVFPTLQEVCTAFNFSHEQARKYMQSLAEDGYVEEQGQWFRFPEHKAAEVETIYNEDDIRVAIESGSVGGFVFESEKRKRGRPFGSVKKTGVIPDQIYPAEDKPKISPKGYNIQIKIIQGFMAFIGLGAAIISTYYTFTWMNEFLPFILALLLSFIIVGFSVMAFEVIIIFCSDQITDNKIIKASVIVGFGILWVVATFFSLSSTIAGQVNEDLKKKDSYSTAANSSENQKWKILQDQKIELKERLKDYQQQIKTYNQILSGMNSVQSRKENKGAWNDSNYKLSQTQKTVQKIYDEMEEIRKQEKEILTKNKNVITDSAGEKTDFYQWIAKVLNVRPDRIQFILALVPALFSDLIAPTALAIALFLRSK